MQKVTIKEAVTLGKIWAIFVDYDDVGWACHSLHGYNPLQEQDEDEPCEAHYVITEFGEGKVEVREYQVGEYRPLAI